MTARSAKTLLAANVFVAAFLLFLVQPMVTRLILPWFGGSAGVWTSAVLLFQTLLLGGYLYAHLSSGAMPRKLALVVHLVLLVAALLTLPILPPESLKPPDATAPVWRVLVVLLVTTGMPFFVLSSTSTLSQAWWHRIDAASPPYRLYALSNLASLLALLAYPTLIEPFVGLRQQAYAWSGLMCVFAIISAASAFLGNGTTASDAGPPQERYRPAALWMLVWMTWPAISSMLLLALTASMSVRIAPVPFLWILPLAIYLLSFVICFERPGWYRRSIFIPAYFILLLGESLLMVLALRIPIWQHLALSSALLLAGCVICHGEIYRVRPPAGGLSLYYLLLALGSVMGSVVSAIISPLLFPARWEMHIALAGVMLLVLLALWGSRDSRLKNGRPFYAWFGIGILAGIVVVLLWLDASGSYGMTRMVFRARSFYGEVVVRDAYRPEIGATVRTLYHDGVVHGLQILDERRSGEPISYYWPDSCFGRLMRATESSPSRKIGVIGLGAGAIAAWARDEDQVTFYELDPLMIEVAKEHFTYLCRVKNLSIIPGDARLSLHQQADQQFDLLIVDAFSGNGLPTHLLTVEAIELYRRHLATDGVLVIHISNRYLQLEPVIARLAEATGMDAVVLDSPAGKVTDLMNATDVALLGNAPAILEHPLVREVAHRPVARDSVGLWTDDYSNLLRILR